MKKNALLFFSLLLSLTMFFAFGCQMEQKVSEADVPELLDRNERIQLGNEWDFIQNFYAQQLQVLKKDPQNNESRLNLAQLFVKEARVTGEHGHYYPAALKMTNEILSSATEDKDLTFRALTTKAGVQLSLHEFSHALETAKTAVELNAHNAQIYGVLVDCYVELGDYKNAVKMADQMISIKPDIRSYSRISYLREIHGDYPGAVQAMTMAIKAGYPGYEERAWAMQTLGEMHLLYGEFDKAQSVFEAILAEREDYPFAIAALGQVAIQKGDLQEAERLTKEAIDIIPEVGFYTQLAELYQNQDRNDEVAHLLNEIFLMLEDDVIHGHNMNLEYANVYLQLKNDSEKALEYAMIEFNKRSDNIDVNRVLADIYVHRGELASAKEHIAKASTTESLHPDLDKLKKQTQYKDHYSSL